MFRLAHISDIHLGPLPDVSYRDLASKRVVGYVNWRRNRRKLLTEGTLGAILQSIRHEAPDHLAVTGDLVNLALDAELDLARLWLEALGKPENVSVVPGNHDAYVPGAFDKACKLWAPWMTGDGFTGRIDREAFPYLRVRGKVALIGVSTARATAPFMANGFFRQPQGERLGRILDATARRKLCRIVMIHHPPVRSAVPQHKRLLGIGRFHSVMRQHGAELVLHGHSHLPTLGWIDGKTAPIPVVGVSAAGQGFGGHHPPAQYNLIGVDGKAGDWHLKLTRRGLTGANDTIGDIETLDLAPQRTGTGPLEAESV
ncbi:MAG: metallophosphoesterase [Rhizobiaceae bacterium]|nr:metallophosphoesterase [Rhizobiaceae bacterium]